MNVHKSARMTVMVNSCCVQRVRGWLGGGSAWSKILDTIDGISVQAVEQLIDPRKRQGP